MLQFYFYHYSIILGFFINRKQFECTEEIFNKTLILNVPNYQKAKLGNEKLVKEGVGNPEFYFDTDREHFLLRIATSLLTRLQPSIIQTQTQNTFQTVNCELSEGTELQSALNVIDIVWKN